MTLRAFSECGDLLLHRVFASAIKNVPPLLSDGLKSNKSVTLRMLFEYPAGITEG